MYMNLCVLVQKYIFQVGDSGHLGFAPLAKNAWIFRRYMGALFLQKVHRSRICQKVHRSRIRLKTSQIIVTELRF